MASTFELGGLADLDSLAMMVLRIDERIEGYLNIAAILEALGVNDEVARRYGYSDRFELAKELAKVVDYYRSRGELSS